MHFKGPQILDRDDFGMMHQLGENRVSETVISDDMLDTDARMSDMSNLTVGNQVAQLNNASPMINAAKSPFNQREVSDVRSSSYSTARFN